jgi:hypothetical protein
MRLLAWLLGFAGFLAACSGAARAAISPSPDTPRLIQS